MVESTLWRAFLLFVVHLCLSCEDSNEVSALPVNEIPVRSTWNSLEKYEHDQDLPKHRPHVDFLPFYKQLKPKHKKKAKKIKLIEHTTTKRPKKKRKNVKRKNSKGSKVKKKVKGNSVGDKRKPFDITVHIKMDDT